MLLENCIYKINFSTCYLVYNFQIFFIKGIRNEENYFLLFPNYFQSDKKEINHFLNNLQRKDYNSLDIRYTEFEENLSNL